MTAWGAERVSAALGVAVPLGLPCSSIATDTRSLKAGAVFVALDGDNFDGHDFLDRAVMQGACAAIVRDRTPGIEGLHLITVADTRVAYGRLARLVRGDIPGPVVAITGSNGKTSTREMVAAALGVKWEVHATSGNNNNLVGVPLTILSAAPSTECLVVEVGASEPGEVGRLRDVVEPDISIITNVSAAHLAGFGSLDRVLTEKAALARDVDIALVGTCPPQLASSAATAREVRTVGLRDADVVPESHSSVDGRSVVEFRGVTVRLPGFGVHQAENAMFALAVSEYLGLDIEEVANRISAAELPPGRTELIQVGGLSVINDAYNSNPASLQAALSTVQSLRGDRRLVLVLGSMLELGTGSDSMHDRAIRDAVALDPDVLVAVGDFSRAADGLEFGGDLILAPDADEAGRRLAESLEGGELILLKGSRRMRLEKIIGYLKIGN